MRQASELWPAGNPEAIEIYLHDTSDTGLSLMDFRLVDRSRVTSLVSWSQLVNRYSTLDLTVATDRLIALSGLANVFQQLLSSDYFARHWVQNLAQSLHWKVTAFSRSMLTCHEWKHVPDVYISPSWSWASAAGEVSMPITFSDKETKLCVVTDVRVDTLRIYKCSDISFGENCRMKRLDWIRGLQYTRKEEKRLFWMHILQSVS